MIRIKVVESSSLTLMDLGYFCLDAFRAIAEKSAFFLSRYFYPTALLDEGANGLTWNGSCETRRVHTPNCR